jgi:hypothetical protein
MELGPPGDFFWLRRWQLGPPGDFLAGSDGTGPSRRFSWLRRCVGKVGGYRARLVEGVAANFRVWVVHRSPKLRKFPTTRSPRPEIFCDSVWTGFAGAIDESGCSRRSECSPNRPVPQGKILLRK